MVRRLSPETVATQHRWVRERDAVVDLINRVREDFSAVFDTHVDRIDADEYRAEVDRVFAEGDLAVNVAALVAVLRNLDVEEDYPGFVVDEILGRELAGMVAGNQPLGVLGEAAFHYVDLIHHPPEVPADGDGAADIDENRTAGLDDLEAALAAGFQTRMPGWDWRERPSPFGI
jgi:hypothetical protein